MWIYSQSTGTLWNPGFCEQAQGYSGYDLGKNNPAMENVRNVGPIPRGFWVIGPPYDSKRVGPHAIPLYEHEHDAHDRTYFRIHGDSARNPGKASKGCVILPRIIREKISDSNCKLLLVIE